MKPAQILYHGTCYRYYEKIEKQGLKPINHKEVYLTADVIVAYDYAKKASVSNDLSFPTLCIINAEQMYKDGFEFTHNVSTAEYTVGCVPSKYIVQVMPESEDELSRLVHYAQEQVVYKQC